MPASTTDHIGPYELRGELGRGAMARVWRAWDPNLAREVAIKEPLFDPRLPEDVRAELGRRFVVEGRAAARLVHRGTVTIYAADVWDGRPAIVMELVRGETLAARLARGPLAPREALAVLDQLLDVVGYAHSCGVVHRDIKPDNVFVTPEGVVKLADFGIARVDDGASARQTVAGTVIGTPGYMSPEQALGRPVDARSDLFSIGVVAYEMLTGSNPFGASGGTNATTLIYRIVHEPVPELSPAATAGLPADLRPAIMAALSKDPASRPATAEEFRRMLQLNTWPVPTIEPEPASEVPLMQAQTGANPMATGRKAVAQRTAPPTWLPYVAVLVVGVVALVAIFLSATSGTRGGVSSASTGATQVQDVTPVGQETSLYVGVYNGEMALFEEGSSEPVTLLDLSVSELTPEDAAALGAHVTVSSSEEAWKLADTYREHVKEAEAEQASYPPSFIEATASSELPGDSVTPYYGARNVLSDDFTLAWNEGVDGDGIGEWVKVQASYPQRVSGVLIVNGYPKTKDIYEKNNRCKDVTIELSDGYTLSTTLEDSFGTYQEIDFGGAHATTYVKITIDSIYKGSKWEDTALCVVQAY